MPSLNRVPRLGGGDGFKTSDYAAMVAEARVQPPIRARRVPRHSGLGRVARRWRHGPLSVFLGGAGVRRWPPSIAVNIQYTSGTTGFPKGATLTTATS